MNKFTAMLAERHSLSRVCAGREKKEVDEILDTPLTILDCSMTVENLEIDGIPTEFACVVFAEYPDYYFCAGTKLTAICRDIISLADANNISIQEMDIRIKLHKVKTKGNNTFTDVLFLN